MVACQDVEGRARPFRNMRRGGGVDGDTEGILPGMNVYANWAVGRLGRVR